MSPLVDYLTWKARAVDRLRPDDGSDSRMIETGSQRLSTFESQPVTVSDEARFWLAVVDVRLRVL